MALKKHSFQTRHEDAKKRLDQVLADRLPEFLGEPLSKGKARKLIVAGAVYLNGKRVRIASKELLANARIDVYVDTARLETIPKTAGFRFTSELILFEDDFLIAVNKPAGLPTQPTLDEARENLFAAVRKFLIEREKNPEAYLGLHHRLDRDTSGVVLFTKDKKANAGVADLFSKHIAQKTYYAITARPKDLPSAEWEIKNYLGKDRSKPGKQARFTAVRSGGDFAHTDFKLLEAFPEGLWVEARPRTGRTHQIRVHLSEMGLPILGDPLYGKGSTSLAPRTLLHARALTFPHPIQENQVLIESPLPEDFSKCLRLLKN